MKETQPIIKTFREVQEPEQLGMYLQGILSCIADAFERGVTQADAKRHVLGDLVTVALDNDKVVGFSSTVYKSPEQTFNLPMKEVGAYFQGATVSREAQGKGIYKQMNALRLQDALFRGTSLVYTRTQNPRVAEGIENQLDEFKENGHIANYFQEKILIPNAYGRMLTKTKPVSKSAEFNALNYEAGDAYVLLYYLVKDLVREREEAQRGNRFGAME